MYDLLDHTEALQARDQHGNLRASEGCTRCYCGCKYWENDRCVDCGALYHPDMDKAEDERLAADPELADAVRPWMPERLAEVERGYGPAGMQTKEGADNSQREYEEAQAKLAEQVKTCRYCKAAKTRAANLRAKMSPEKAERTERNRPLADVRCKEHAMRGRLNFACSPVSENYWCS